MTRTLISPRRTWAILLKELTQLRRDKPTLAMMVMIPLMQLMLFGYAINTDPKHMPTAVLAQDHGAIARSFIVGLKNTDYFQIERAAQNEAEAHKLLEQGRVQFVVTIPENFGRALVRGERPALLLETDATDPTASAGALAALSGMTDTLLKRELTGALAHLKNAPPPFEIRVHRLYNPEGFSRYNIVPGLMGVVLTMTGVMMTALALTRERERGTMENLLSMPVRPMEVMTGKIAPYVVVGYVQSALILFAAKYLFGVPILGSLPLLFAILGVFIVCNLALGFTVSAAAQNQMQALQLSILPFLPSVLLSGFMFPFRGMPVWAQTIGNMLPATYYIRVVRGILLKGSDVSALWPHIWPLLLFMVLITLFAMKLYRRTLD